MLAFIYFFDQFFHLVSGPMGIVIGIPAVAFTIWMLIDCLGNQRPYYWYWVLIGLPVLGSLIYYYVYKWEGSKLEHSLFLSRRDRAVIAELQARCYQLDQAVNWEELGDAYWKARKPVDAEQAYREALKRNPTLVDSHARLGYSLLMQGKAAEAWPFIEEILNQHPNHDQDEVVWKAARCHAALGRLDEAKRMYEDFLSKHSYYEAQVEYAELLIKSGDKESGCRVCNEVINDLKNSPKYVRNRNSAWNSRARRLLRA